MPTSTVTIAGRRLPGRRWHERANVHLGVQHRSEVIGLTPGDADLAIFDLSIDIVRDPALGIDFRGPVVHGGRGQRFLYLSWGDLDVDGRFTMFRRAKLSLNTMPEHITEALSEGRAVRAELDLTDEHGGPICASVPPPLIDWTIDEVSSRDHGRNRR